MFGLPEVRGALLGASLLLLGLPLRAVAERGPGCAIKSVHSAGEGPIAMELEGPGGPAHFSGTVTSGELALNPSLYLRPIGPTFYSEFKVEYELRPPSEAIELRRALSRLISSKLGGHGSIAIGGRSYRPAAGGCEWRDSGAASEQALALGELESEIAALAARVSKGAKGRALAFPFCASLKAGSLAALLVSADGKIVVTYFGDSDTHELYAGACMQTGMEVDKVIVRNTTRPAPAEWLADLAAQESCEDEQRH